MPSATFSTVPSRPSAWQGPWAVPRHEYLGLPGLARSYQRVWGHARGQGPPPSEDIAIPDDVQ
eukprot:8706615-Lingulodinium_polyedra.AAC.1